MSDVFFLLLLIFLLVAAYLSYLSSENQLKRLGLKEYLLLFLSPLLQVDSRTIQAKHSGSCPVIKVEGNLYIKATTLQIQGKDIADKIRFQLVSMAVNQTESDVN